MTRFDVIIVGGRVAGAATAMLLARAGLRVLALEQAAFGSDTVSSHQVQVPGVALLARWGLLDRLARSGAPATPTVRFDAGAVAFSGSFPSVDGVHALYSPRRTVLDPLLVEAARASGAELRDRTRVEGLETDESGRVVGVRCRGRGGRPAVERARMVVGADGKHSTVARLARARTYRRRPPRAFASYGYWSGVPLTAGELYHRPRRMVAAFPTNDEATMVYVAGPLSDFAAFRADPVAAHLATLDRCGDLGERVRAGVGDAGVVMDSVTAQGISNALRDAAGLAQAIVDGLGGAVPLATALRRHHRRRDAVVRGMFDMTLRLARFWPPGLIVRRFYETVAAEEAEVTRFLGAFAGITDPGRYFRPGSVLRRALRPR